jgi:hypothetical protein
MQSLTWHVRSHFSSWSSCTLNYPTDTYKLVHAFLAERSHKKVASALKQAVNGIATIEDGVDHKGPTLQQILKEWKELKAAAGAEWVPRPYMLLCFIQTTPENPRAPIPIPVCTPEL